MTYYHTICGLTKTKSSSASTTGNRETDHCTGCPYLLPYGQQMYDAADHCYKLHTEGYECRMPQDKVAYNSAISGHLGDKTSCYIASLDFDFLQRVSDWIESNYHDGELIGSFSRDKIRGVEYVSNGRYRMSIACAQNRKGMEAKADLFRTFFDEHGGRLDMTPEAEKAKIMADIKAGLESQAADPPADPPEDDTDAAGKTYRDPSTDILYRVKSEPYKDSYFVEYLDRQSSVRWKGIYTDGNETYAGEQKYLDALAKSRGLVLAGDDIPAEQPEPVAETAAIAAPETALAAFDYSGMDAQTVDTLHKAESVIRKARQKYIVDVAQAVAIVHEQLSSSDCRTSSHANQHSEDTFIRWCRSVNLSKSTSYQLLQVNALMSGSTPDEQAVLDQAPATLLYAAAKPSAPAEAVEAVKAGDVTTMPEYKALLAELDRVKHEAAMDRKEREDTTAAADRLLAERNAANRELGQLQDAVKRNGALLDSAECRAKAAEARAKELESRPIDVAVQEPTEEQIAEYAHKRITDATAMLQAQVHGLQEELDNARRSADLAEDTIFDTAAAYAEQAAHMIDSIRSAFWELAQGLQSDDFDRAAEPLQAAASAIADGSWEDAEGGDA